jgi:tyrosine-protein kinase Etk/Wzc
VIMPPQQSSPGLGALAELGALGAMTGGGLGIKTSDESYLAFLKSRRLQNALIEQFELVKRYEVAKPEAARFALNNLVNATSDKKSGLITIEVEDQDPKFATELAAAHVVELRKMLRTIAVTDAQQRRVFYEAQVKDARAQLSVAESRFLSEQARGGFVVTQALAENSVRAGIELRSRIASREVALQSLESFATPQNPEVQRAMAELSAMRDQLAKLEHGQGVSGVQNNAAGIDADGRAGGTALVAYREMKVREAALEALIRQFELAKVDESREGGVLQVVDVASASDIPSRPKRTQFVVLAAAVSLLMGCFVVVIRAALRNPDERGLQAINRLKRAWSLGKS